MPIPLFQIDAFTDTPFAGNPAAVCLLEAPRPVAWMSSVAREMNLSETAFLVRRSDGFDLRWFTPAIEVDLCGHATLASAHMLWETQHVPPDQTLRFHTKSGVLTADRRGDWIELDFPARIETPAPAPEGLTAALGLTAPRYVGRFNNDYLIEVESESIVAGLAPDFSRLRALPVRGVIVTSRASSAGVDFVSRFFAPGAGVDEDPVTGSAHCLLTPYWHQRLGRTELIARQLSARGGLLRLSLDGDRVRISGQAVTVVRGELLDS